MGASTGGLKPAATVHAPCLHRRRHEPPDAVAVCSQREHRAQRYVGAQLTVHYDRKQVILEQTDTSKSIDFFDNKSIEVRWQGHLLPYRV